MTGYFLGLAPCLVCAAVFAFDPERVPSLNGRPICRACLDEINAVRAKAGAEPFAVLPGAYPDEGP